MPRATLEPASGDLDDELGRLIEMKGGSPDADLVKETLKTVLGLLDDGTKRGELKIINTALLEMRRSFQVFAPYTAFRKVSIFGSARTPSGRPEYLLAQRLGRRLAELGFMVITGAGGGIMRAAAEGAGRAMSFGCHIRLPFENVEERLFDEPRLVKYKYFFTRKLTFVKETDGLVLFPGGFGTLDECFEVLTLIQTGKSELLPVVFIDTEEGNYWRSFERHLHEQLVPRGLISPEDLNLFLLTNDIERAAQEIAGFYRNYHSTRYVRDLTVVRHVEPLSDEALQALNEEFSDLLLGGRIERSSALPAEANEPDIADLPRLVMQFNRRDFGRFRRLVDRLNQAVPAVAGEAPGRRPSAATLPE
jgi:hypothetical protein